MQIITRKEALEKGLPRYYTGKPCKHGHVSERYTKSKDCIECSYARSKRLSNIWAKNNPEKHRENSKRWARKNRERHIKNARAYQVKNRAKVTSNALKRRCLKLNATPSWVNYTLIDLKYKERETMSRITGIIHHVDHIIPLQGKNVCGLHVHNNLRVIPARDNLRKSNKLELR